MLKKYSGEIQEGLKKELQSRPGEFSSCFPKCHGKVMINIQIISEKVRCGHYRVRRDLELELETRLRRMLWLWRALGRHLE